MPFDNHIKKMVELGPDKIKKVYEELTNYRNEKGPLGISINYNIIILNLENVFVVEHFIVYLVKANNVIITNSLQSP